MRAITIGPVTIDLAAMQTGTLENLRRAVDDELEQRLAQGGGLTEYERTARPIEAIKAIRSRTGLGLSDSKKLYDRLISGEAVRLVRP